MMLKCWIIDDEPLALTLLESYVNRTPFLKLTGKYSSAISAMKDLGNEQVDVMFIDIQMPEVNGMEFSQIVGPDTRIIFTTAFSEYVINIISSFTYLYHQFVYLLMGILYHMIDYLIM